MSEPSGFEGFPLQEAIRREAASREIAIDDDGVAALGRHARAVLAANPELHLTTIVVPAEFVSRHIGEAFDGAARLDPEVEGVMLDVGSGNGYPGLPLAIARPGLRPVLAEAKRRKAAFLRTVVAADGFDDAEVLERHVERAADIESIERPVVLTTRAVGGWDKIVPRLVGVLRDDAHVLIWAGDLMLTAIEREAWKKLELVSRTPLPDRDRSWIWTLRKRTP